MRLLPLMLTALLALGGFANASEPEATAAPVYVKLETSDGDIFLELDPVKAPITVANFVEYVKEGHYDGTIFHRVIPGFMAQGGGYRRDLSEKTPSREPIQNESRNGLANLRGTIAMARTNDPHSARAQFFINLVDNSRLNGTDYRWGYAVFGKVVKGMEVVDAIAQIPTGPAGPFTSDVPFRPVEIRKASVLEALPAEAPVAGKAK